MGPTREHPQIGSGLLRVTTRDRIESGIHWSDALRTFTLLDIGAFLRALLALLVEFPLLRSRGDPLP